MLEPGAPFHIHFSDIQFANRNETKHLPYGEGTLRAEPLREALARFERPATVISESPDAESTAGDPGDPRGVGSRDGDPAAAARDAGRSACRRSSRRRWRTFCEPIDVISVGVRRADRDHARTSSARASSSAVAFELAEPRRRETEEGDRELRLVADRFYETMPEDDPVAGGCNFLEPGGDRRRGAEKAQQVFSR